MYEGTQKLVHLGFVELCVKPSITKKTSDMMCGVRLPITTPHTMYTLRLPFPLFIVTVAQKHEALENDGWWYHIGSSRPFKGLESKMAGTTSGNSTGGLPDVPFFLPEW